MTKSVISSYVFTKWYSALNGCKKYCVLFDYLAYNRCCNKHNTMLHSSIGCTLYQTSIFSNQVFIIQWEEAVQSHVYSPAPFPLCLYCDIMRLQILFMAYVSNLTNYEYIHSYTIHNSKLSGKKNKKRVFSECLLRICVLRVSVLFCVFLCTGRFVMVPLNLTCIQWLQHSFFEHLFSLYDKKVTILLIFWQLFKKTFNIY